MASRVEEAHHTPHFVHGAGTVAESSKIGRQLGGQSDDHGVWK